MSVRRHQITHVKRRGRAVDRVEPVAPAAEDQHQWVKSKCLNREEFVVIGWTDPEGSRSHIGALLLGYLCVPKIRFGVDAGNGPRKIATR
jgi:hypothetical protein